jgi:diacylglycerol O-acyltransferase
VLRQFGIGPLPGVAMMVVLVSRGGYATVTARYDRAAIADQELFARCLRQGFDEVLALGGEPLATVTPVSFAENPSPSKNDTTSTKNGSVAYS